MDKLILSASDVAGILGLHINTVKRLPPEKLPYFRITNRGDRRYMAEDVKRYLELCRVER